MAGYFVDDPCVWGKLPGIKKQKPEGEDPENAQKTKEDPDAVGIATAEEKEKK